MRKKWWPLLAGAVMLLLAGIGVWRAALDRPEAVSEEKLNGPALNKAIDRVVAPTHSKGAIAAIKNGQVVTVRTYGYANAQTKQPITGDTLFPIASMEKPMTAALIAQLIREGKLNYTTKLSRFYPAITGADQVTVRELLNHTSGLAMDEVPPASELTTDKAALAYTVHEVTNTQDKSFNYTNANFVLLAGIVDQLTGESFNQALKKRILDPLHLTHTYDYRVIPKGSVVAEGYKYDNGRDYVPEELDHKLLSSLLGTGSLYMSIKDMAAFQLALSDGRLLTRPQFKELTEQPDHDGNYSGGFFNLDEDTRLVVGQYDDFPNSFNTVFEAYNTNSAGVLMFANQFTDADTKKMAEEILGHL